MEGVPHGISDRPLTKYHRDVPGPLRRPFQERRRAQPPARSRSYHDDTGQLRKPSKGAHGSDGVSCQYIGNVGKVDSGIVFVSTHYVDERKHFPVTSELFWSKKARKVFEERQNQLRSEGNEARSVTEKMRRDKIDIALDQIREAKQMCPWMRRALAYAWYGSSPRYVKGLEADGLEYVVAVRSNRTVFVRLPGDPRGGEKPEHSVKEVLALLEKEDFERITVKRAGGPEDVRYVVGMKIKVKGLGKGRRRLVIVARRSGPQAERAGRPTWIGSTPITRKARSFSGPDLRASSFF